MTKAEEVMEALVEFSCGEIVWLVAAPYREATILRRYDYSYHLVEVYESGCYMQRLWNTHDIRRALLTHAMDAG